MVSGFAFLWYVCVRCVCLYTCMRFLYFFFASIFPLFVFVLFWPDYFTFYLTLFIFLKLFSGTCLFSHEREKKKVCGFGWVERWRGSGRSLGGQTIIRIHCMKSYISNNFYKEMNKTVLPLKTPRRHTTSNTSLCRLSCDRKMRTVGETSSHGNPI